MKITLGQLRQIIKEELSSSVVPQPETPQYEFDWEFKEEYDKSRDEISVKMPVVMKWTMGEKKYEFLTHVTYSMGVSRERGGGRKVYHELSEVEPSVGAAEGFYEEIVPGSLDGVSDLKDVQLVPPNESTIPEEFWDEGGEFDKLAAALKIEAESPEKIDAATEGLTEYHADILDAEEEASDPYGYRGLRRSDFY